VASGRAVVHGLSSQLVPDQICRVLPVFEYILLFHSIVSFFRVVSGDPLEWTIWTLPISTGNGLSYPLTSLCETSCKTTPVTSRRLTKKNTTSLQQKATRISSGTRQYGPAPNSFTLPVLTGALLEDYSLRFILYCPTIPFWWPIRILLYTSSRRNGNTFGLERMLYCQKSFKKFKLSSTTWNR
jgi:hypothetical protein